MLRLGGFRVSPHQSRVQIERNPHRQVVRRGLGWSLASDSEAAPCLVTLMNDLGRIFFVLGLAGESEGVLALAVGNLVNPVLDCEQNASRGV